MALPALVCIALVALVVLGLSSLWLLQDDYLHADVPHIGGEAGQHPAKTSLGPHYQPHDLKAFALMTVSKEIKPPNSIRLESIQHMQLAFAGHDLRYIAIPG